MATATTNQTDTNIAEFCSLSYALDDNYKQLN